MGTCLPSLILVTALKPWPSNQAWTCVCMGTHDPPSLCPDSLHYAGFQGVHVPAATYLVQRMFGKIRLKYIIRPNSELMENENDKMIICEGPSGCKKYLALQCSV
eukprot:scaffold8377_cov143-Isochrysis_galbana.AAC.2